MKIIELPREAFQGFSRTIPTEEKVRYLNLLMRTGFDVVETGSLASPVLIPQLADSEIVLDQLQLAAATSVMMLAVSRKSAERIALLPRVTHISYPYSISSTFLQRNLNTTPERSMETVVEIINLCEKHGKIPVIYLSMAFGNPYNDPWNPEILKEHVAILAEKGVRIMPLSNVAIPVSQELISEVFSTLIPGFPEIEFGLHLHTSDQDWYPKLNAAWEAGCRRFDGVMRGMGGCPMTGGELMPNIHMEYLVEFAGLKGEAAGINRETFRVAMKMADELFFE